MDPTQPPMPTAAQTQMSQATADPTQLQNALLLQALSQNAQGQQASLGNQQLAGQAGLAGQMGAMPAGSPVQPGTPIGQGQPPISPAAYGAMFGVPGSAY